MKISVIIPLYKSINSIDKTINTLINLLEKEIILELILINDGCDQDYITILKKYKAIKNLKVMYFNSIINYGQYYAAYVGLKVFSSEKVVTLDSDFYLIKNLEEIILKGVMNKNPVVFVRLEKKYKLVRFFLSTLFHFFIILITMKNPKYKGSSFRIIDRLIIKDFLRSNMSPLFLDIFLIKHTKHFSVLNAQMDEEKQSSYGMNNFFFLLLISFLEQKKTPIK